MASNFFNGKSFNSTAVQNQLTKIICFILPNASIGPEIVLELLVTKFV